MVLKDEHLADKKDFALYFVVYDAVYEGDYSPISASFSELPQLVSRQFWAETSQVFHSLAHSDTTTSVISKDSHCQIYQ
jgi:hypothetical protein